MNDEMVKYGDQYLPAKHVQFMAKQHIRYMEKIPDYDWRNDDLYYAADRVRAKRRSRLKQ